MGKRTAQKDTIIDIISDSQVNSNFPYRWSPASLTFNNYFYLFLYLYITRITINYNTPHIKSPKNQNRRATLGRPAIKQIGLQNIARHVTRFFWFKDKDKAGIEDQYPDNPQMYYFCRVPFGIISKINLKEFLQVQKLHSKKRNMGQTSKFRLLKPHQ